MSTQQLLLPLRIPELGPHLGKLIVGTGRQPGGFRLDAHRERLVTRMLDRAGEARRLASRGERPAAVATLGRDAWMEAWEDAVASVSETLVTQIDRHLEAEANAVRMPSRLRARIHLDATETRAIAARLGSAGAELVSALDELERRGQLMLQATTADREVVAGWENTLLTVARRLEAAWLALEEALDREVDRWRTVAAGIAAWRKPLWPILVVGSIALALAVWVGLVLGGYLPAPSWLRSAWGMIT